jgi:phosphoribosylformylglycinamidine synthase
VKPLEGLPHPSPNDAGVCWYGAYGVEGNDGFAVASGLCPHFSIDDTKLMAELAVDEAVRNLMCHGVDPEKVALVDNFCWPDPTPSARNPDAEFKLAQLVRTCMGLREIMETYQMPLVSGKDSMKNDYHGEKVKISVLPTLLVTALGHVPDVSKVPKSQAKPGHLLYRLGEKNYQNYFGHFLHNVTDIPRNNSMKFDWKKTRSLYQSMFEASQKELFSSVHDLSEGGFLVSLFETLMMNQLGIKLNVPAGVNETSWLYSELPGHFIVGVTEQNKSSFEKHFASSDFEPLGVTNTSGKIEVGSSVLAIQDLEKTWRKL